MKLLVANHGSYPRAGDRPEQQRLREALALFERRRFSARQLEDARRAAAREAVDEQLRAGADLPTDGLVRWSDPVSHFTDRMKGAPAGPLVRYFDTDFFYREPLPSGRVSAGKPALAEEYRAARREGAPLKAVLTGPFTLAKLSRLPAGRGAARRLAAQYAEALAGEVAALAAAGAGWIQIDEPALARFPREIDAAAEALEPLLRRRGAARVMLAVYFGPLAELYRDLCFLPADALALDFTADREALVKRILKEGAPKPLGLGAADGRNSRLEPLPDLLALLERLRPVLKAPENFLMPSCGLEFLPRDRAFAKLARLAEARNHFLARMRTASGWMGGPRP